MSADIVDLFSEVIAEFFAKILENMKKDPSRGGFLDKILCLYYLDLAMMQDGMKMIEASEESLQRAVKMAAEFDRNPDYSLDNMILLEHLEKQSVYDDAGPTALDGMINTLQECGISISDEFRKKAMNLIEAAKR